MEATVLYSTSTSRTAIVAANNRLLVKARKLAEPKPLAEISWIK